MSKFEYINTLDKAYSNDGIVLLEILPWRPGVPVPQSADSHATPVFFGRK